MLGLKERIKQNKKKELATNFLLPSLEKMRDTIKPRRGQDYFTQEDIDFLIAEIRKLFEKANQEYRELLKQSIKEITPIKGIHYQDGVDGKDADEEKIIKRILPKIIIPKVKDGKDADEEKIVEKVLSKIPEPKEKEYTIKDIKDLEEELTALRSRVSKNYGGHGGTRFKVTTTTTDNLTFTFDKGVQKAEMTVHRGGAQIFEENSDYVSIMTADRVTSITLITALDVADGEKLNIYTR